LVECDGAKGAALLIVFVFQWIISPQHSRQAGVLSMHRLGDWAGDHDRSFSSRGW
jgi:hypothetical protein